MSAHSAHAGTSHRGQFVGSLVGLPVTFTPVQEAQNLPHAEHRDDATSKNPCTCPDCSERTYQRHRPGTVHRVYADGRVVGDVTTRPPHPLHGWTCIREANKLARDARRAGAQHVTVDAWMPEAATSDAWDTIDSSGTDLPTIYAELEAERIEWLKSIGHIADDEQDDA